MQEPLSKREKPNLSVVADTTFDGGGGGPPSRLAAKNARLLWALALLGAIITTFGLYLLAVDPNSSDHFQPHWPNLSDLRFYAELLVFSIGSGCLVTALACMKAKHKARFIERQSSGKVASLEARKLDKISDRNIFAIVGEFVSNSFEHF